MRICIFSFSPYFLPIFIFFSYFCPQIVPRRDARDKNLSPEDNESHLSLK